MNIGDFSSFFLVNFIKIALILYFSGAAFAIISLFCWMFSHTQSSHVCAAAEIREQISRVLITGEVPSS